MSDEMRKMIDKVQNFKQSINENQNEKSSIYHFNKNFSIYHFVVGDEVYLVNGNGEPFGMVAKIGQKNIFVKPHDKTKKPLIIKKPTELYLGQEWHHFNKAK